ncbi:hypothetical protein ACVJGC_008333 [Bradyrhizobium diazoefficiens]
MRGVLVYCHCGHHIALSADRWPDDVRLSGIEPRFVCAGCGRRGAEVRPDFESGMPPQFASSNARETAAKRPYFACELMKRELSAIGYIAGLAAYRVPRA